MPFVEFALIGMSLAQVSGRAIGSVLAQIPGGVAGNFAHELTKVGFRSLVERSRTGALAANHDLIRACRRAQSRATAVGARHFARAMRQAAQADEAHKTWARWAATLARFLDEDVVQTRLESYKVPPSAIDGRQAELLSLIEGAPGDAAGELQRLVVEQLLAELRAWHRREWVNSGLGASDLAPGFETWLRDGWPYVAEEPTLARRVWSVLTQRRGDAARMVRRAQDTVQTQESGETLKWFRLFAAFFAEELKVETRVQAIFDARLLVDIQRRLSLSSVTTPGLTAEDFGAALRAGLDEWGGRVLQEIEDLRLLADDILSVAVDTREEVRELRSRLEQSVFHRGAMRVPRQLPPEAVVGDLIGRTRERAMLRDRLRAGKDSAVVGPAGCGKTALAAAAVRDVVGGSEASLAAGPYPDGVVFLDLYKLKPRDEDVWGALASAFIGTDLADRPARSRAVEACRNRRALIIFEGAELADGQDGRASLIPLIEVLDPASRKLVLTRSSAQVDPGIAVTLDAALTPDEAKTLLQRRAGDGIAPHVLQRVLALVEGHPLALTWAGGLLRRGDEPPGHLCDEWISQRLPSIADPEYPSRTLGWLFRRSVLGLSDDAKLVLEAAGLLASDWFALGALDAVLEGGESATRPALRSLVQAGILRLSATEADQWQFTHVLGYQFARNEEDADPRLCKRLGEWLRVSLERSIANGDPAGVALLPRLLRHVAALAKTDHEQQLWTPLINSVLYDLHDSLTSLGRLDLRNAALESVSAWLTMADPHAAEWRRERASLSMKLGDVQKAQGNLVGAGENYESARVIAEDSTSADPQNVLRQHDLSVTYNRLGDLRVAQGDLVGARTSYEECREIVKRLAARDPQDDNWQYGLSVSHERVGNVQQEQGDLVEPE